MKEQSNHHVKVKTLVDEKLLESRIVVLNREVSSESCTNLIKQIWYLNLKSPKDPILFVINSPGGSVTDGLALWDQIKIMPAPITTLVTGLAASMASILSLVAPKGRRLATKMSRIMIHQPRICGTISGQAVDLQIQAQEIKKTKKLLVDLYVDATGKDRETVDKDIDRDYWMTSKESLDYGLIDEIVDRTSQLSSFFCF